MRRLLAFLLTAALAAAGLVACTPKPPSAEPVAADFLAALAEADLDTVAGLVDSPDEARAATEQTWSGLQAEGLDAELTGLDTPESTDAATATAHARLTWHLPRGRDFAYDTDVNLQREGRDWTVHWQPTVLHPRLGAHQHLELRPVVAEKASVVSSDGVALLTPGVRHRLLVDGSKTDTPGKLSREITEALHAADVDAGIDPAELEKNLRETDGPYSVTMLDDAAADGVAKRFAGDDAVTLNDEAAMVTPEPGFAPDILSRVRAAVGDELDGANGWRVAVVNPEGNELDDVEHHDARLAPAVRVSIDHSVQLAAQRALEAHAKQKAVIVAVRPSNGDILAVAQTPEADKDGDIALTGQYPPGSVFKMITATAGVADEGLTPDSTVPCPGTMDIYGRTVTNYNASGVGDTSLETAFARSCNTTFADISTKLEPGQLEHTAKQFGLGLSYDIPGLETVTGSVPFGETPLDRTESGYGQGLDLASPFGLAMVAATAAAGRTPTPQLVTGPETTVDEQIEPPDPEAIAALQRMMRTVVTNGTAAGMSAGGEIHGKTGEAEVNDGSHAWFAGYRDDIAFATLVVYGGGSETSVAITDEFFRHLDGDANPEEIGAAPGEAGQP